MTSPRSRRGRSNGSERGRSVESHQSDPTSGSSALGCLPAEGVVLGWSRESFRSLAESMLSFATEFPLRAGASIDDFLAVIAEWIAGSPHNQIDLPDLAGMRGEAHWSLCRGGDSLRVRCIKDPPAEIAAVHYTNFSDDLEWTTEVVFHRSGPITVVGVRVSRESSVAIQRLPSARRPIIVKMLLDKIGGGEDGGIVVSSSAIKLKEHEVGIAAGLMLGAVPRRLPMVFLSCPFRGSVDLNADRLAYELAGMAVVVVEPSRSFSQRLKMEVSGQNAFGGAVGVYFPDAVDEPLIIFPSDYSDERILYRKVRDTVRFAIINRRPTAECTWVGAEGVASRIAFQELKDSGSQEIGKYIEEFDSEIQAKDSELREANSEIERLKAQIRSVRQASRSVSGCTLRTGMEQDLYHNEIKGMLLFCLREELARSHPESRKFHILNAIINDNNDVDSAQPIRDSIKGILRNYRTMTPKIRSDLENLGFDIEEEGKHIKIIYRGDGRYTFTLPKTSSDVRAGLNISSDISKRLF